MAGLPILVDYDNVPVIERTRGLVNLVDKIVRVFDKRLLLEHQRVRIRLYGGWYGGPTMSRDAQSLSADIARQFPRYISLDEKDAKGRIFVRTELSHTLECDRRSVFTHTMRDRDSLPHLYAKDPPYPNCKNAGACPFDAVRSIIKTEKCSIDGCSVVMQDVLWRREQKLVDAMLISDIIYLASRDDRKVLVVSNDSDIWPGVHSAVMAGGEVHQLHPYAGRRTPSHFASLLGRGYFQCGF